MYVRFFYKKLNYSCSVQLIFCLNAMFLFETIVVLKYTEDCHFII